MQEPVHGHQQTDEVTFNVRYPSHRNKPEILTCLMHAPICQVTKRHRNTAPLQVISERDSVWEICNTLVRIHICDSNINILKYADIITRDKLGIGILLNISMHSIDESRPVSYSVFIGHSPVDKLSTFHSSAVIGVVRAREPVSAPSTCQGPPMH